MLLRPTVTCMNCTRRCDDRSLNNYHFEDDAVRSEAVERHILKHVNLRSNGQIVCRKSIEPGYPDLEITLSSSPQTVRARLELKCQTRAFMKVADKLPYAHLNAWETIALNLSDLERYIKIYEEENVPTHLVWRLKRHCLGDRYFHQDIVKLRDLLGKYKNKRRWRRASGQGDVDEHGRHRGVVVNYHFSVNELLPFNGYLDFLNSLSTD